MEIISWVQSSSKEGLSAEERVFEAPTKWHTLKHLLEEGVTQHANDSQKYAYKNMSRFGSAGISVQRGLRGDIEVAWVDPEGAAGMGGEVEIGDVLHVIDGLSTEGITVTQAAALLNGDMGSVATLVLGKKRGVSRAVFSSPFSLLDPRVLPVRVMLFVLPSAEGLRQMF